MLMELSRLLELCFIPIGFQVVTCGKLIKSFPLFGMLPCTPLCSDASCYSPRFATPSASVLASLSIPISFGVKMLIGNGSFYLKINFQLMSQRQAGI